VGVLRGIVVEDSRVPQEVGMELQSNDSAGYLRYAL
jgi:hypothetical protein